MNLKVLDHLQSRPIAIVSNVLTENGNSSALKLICVLDYELEMTKLYTEIAAIPNLSEQLLKFHSFAKFKYFSYKLPKYLFGNKLLRCKFCRLVGPYVTMLEHMAISHNWHADTKLCMWCEKTKFKVHVSQNTLNQCYGLYEENQQLDNIKCPKVIKTFYDLLKKLAKRLHVKISRSDTFRSKLKRKNNIGNEMVVLISKHEIQKEMNLSVLETLYQTAMVHFYREEIHAYLVFDTQVKNNSQLEDDKRDSAGFDQNSIQSNLTIEIDPAQVDMSQSPSRFQSPHSTMHFDTPSPQLEVTPSSQSNKQHKSSLEVSSGEKFTNFIASALGHIKNDQLKEQAKSEIQSIVFDLLAQDMVKQMIKKSQIN